MVLSHSPFQDALKLGAKKTKPWNWKTPSWELQPILPAGTLKLMIFLVPAGRASAIQRPHLALQNVVPAKLLAMSKPMTIATPSWAFQREMMGKGQRVEGPFGDDTKQSNWNNETIGNHGNININPMALRNLNGTWEWYWNKNPTSDIAWTTRLAKKSNSRHHCCIEQANHRNQCSIQRVHWLRNMHTFPVLHMIHKYDHVCKYFQIAGTYII